MRTCVVAAVLLALSSSLLADEVVRERIPLNVETKANATEQLKYGRSLISKVWEAGTEFQKTVAIGEAAAALELVAIVWPTERATILKARLAQWELLKSHQWYQNALEVMLKTGDTKGTAYEAMVLWRVAEMNEILGRAADAESAFDSLGPALDHPDLPTHEKRSALVAQGGFHERRGEHQSATTAFRRLANDPKVPAGARATFALEALENSTRISPTEARRDLELLRSRIREFADAGMEDAGSVAVLGMLTRELSRYEQELHQ